VLVSSVQQSDSVIHSFSDSFAVTSGNGKSHTIWAAEPEERARNVEECGAGAQVLWMSY